MTYDKLNQELFDALQNLLDWGRDNTSPRDENTPHLLLIAAAEALDHAKAVTQ